MANWTSERKTLAIEIILDCIRNGQSLIGCLNSRSREEVPSSVTWNQWLKDDEELINNYTRACEERSELIFEQILDIADDKSEDTVYTDSGNAIFNAEFAARSRIKIDARKWMLGKMNPKKYGDKVQTEHSGKIEGTAPTTLNITLPNGKTIDDFKL